MRFFDDTTRDSDDTPPPESDTDSNPTDESFDPDNIEIGISATELTTGEVDLEIVVYIDDIEAPLPPEDTELVAWERWHNGAPEPDPNAEDDPHPALELVGYERAGWGVICHPDESEEWIAMPYKDVIPDVTDTF